MKNVGRLNGPHTRPSPNRFCNSAAKSACAVASSECVCGKSNKERKKKATNHGKNFSLSFFLSLQRDRFPHSNFMRNSESSHLQRIIMSTKIKGESYPIYPLGTKQATEYTILNPWGNKIERTCSRRGCEMLHHQVVIFILFLPSS